MFRDILLVLALAICGINAECYYIEVEHAYNYDVNGVYYIFDYDVECEDRNIYRHIDRPLYMFHINGYWVVHNNAYCVQEATTQGLARAYDFAWTPELIQFEIWEERANNAWSINAVFDVDCYYGPSALSTVAIVCISIACFIATAAIIVLPIVFCTTMCIHKDDHSRASTPEPVPGQPVPPQATTYVVVSGQPDQPPPYDGVIQMSPEAIGLTSPNPDTMTAKY